MILSSSSWEGIPHSPAPPPRAVAVAVAGVVLAMEGGAAAVAAAAVGEEEEGWEALEVPGGAGRLGGWSALR